MYVPPHYAMADLADQHSLIEQNDFALLVVAGEKGLLATHVPMMLKRAEGPFGTLYAHLARSNPHASLMDREMMAVFTGPHAYVSPTWYSDRSMNVPTWNYSAVHCYGTVTAIAGDTLPLLGEMTALYEGPRADGWHEDELKPNTRENLARGVVAIRMEVSRMDGKRKHSQNKSRTERERIIEGLKEDRAHELAARMVQDLEQA